MFLGRSALVSGAQAQGSLWGLGHGDEDARDFDIPRVHTLPLRAHNPPRQAIATTIRALDPLTRDRWAIGAFFLTTFADQLGRKPVLGGTLLAACTISILSAFSPNLAAYSACRFGIGGCLGGIVRSDGVYHLERGRTEILLP